MGSESVLAVGSAAVVIFLIALYLGMGVWIFAGLMLVAFTGLLFVLDMPISKIAAIMQGNAWAKANSWELACIPLFVWMGDLIFRTDISRRMFEGLAPWVAPLPGRLFHTSIAGCTLFAAISGSSTATTATIGKIATVSLIDRGYDDSLAIGSIAGAGTLGLLIPPSIVMIVYGILVEESVARLFAAGLIPGLVVAFFYSSYIGLRCTLNKKLAPQERKFTRADYLGSFKALAPVLILIPIVLGGIYTGFATPSEAAALGVIGALIIIGFMGQLTLKVILDSLLGAIKVTCMVITIIVAAAFMSSAMSYLHVPQEISAGIAYLGLGPYQLMAVLFVFYLVLGLFLEGISMLVLSIPITFPIVVAQGFDPIWFGIFLTIMVEIAQVTPPVGLNLYVLQGLTGRSIGKVSMAAMPFFLLLTLVVVLITMFPGIALWLPNELYGVR